MRPDPSRADDASAGGAPSRLSDIDFDALYRGDAPTGGGQPTGGAVPWDLGEPQPAVRDFERAGRISGAVLDVGCGLGDNAIFLAACGYRVTAVDGAPTAIERARERARGAAVEVEFAVADATELTGYDDRFDTVLDSALYHCLDGDLRQRYAAALHRVARPGARLDLLCFSDRLPAELPGPDGVTEEDLRTTLGAAGWTITGLRPHTIAARLPRVDTEEADAAARLAVGIATDDRGRALLPAWALEAHRD